LHSETFHHTLLLEYKGITNPVQPSGVDTYVYEFMYNGKDVMRIMYPNSVIIVNKN